jgi:hypothetical protein
MSTEVHEVAVDDAQAVMLAWIETHWAQLAAVAWRGYVTLGRGLVVLDGAWDGAVTVGYLTAADAQAAGSPWPDSLRAATQAYRPALDILFFVQQDAMGTLLGLRATVPRVPPYRATQPQGTLPRVSAA